MVSEGMAATPLYNFGGIGPGARRRGSRNSEFTDIEWTAVIRISELDSANRAHLVVGPYQSIAYAHVHSLVADLDGHVVARRCGDGLFAGAFLFAFGRTTFFRHGFLPP
jgi:hypothetical protein